MPWAALEVDGRTRGCLEHQIAVCVEDWQMEQSGELKPAKWRQKSLVSMLLCLVPTLNRESLAAAFAVNE